uniref:Uncharacterized protein n=1 Tax=Helicotheca tamesis TaxID=374047 RepID=A0A7S2I0F1_9STRA|mmetsp:Transcript_4480/g.6122  ORF Transcript_4480/g.6122 Transcript_4480/m.6122 type:complete len:370 (+) Transcript_4480:1-1110(+)
MNLANEIPLKKEERVTEKRSDSRLDDIFDCAHDPTSGHSPHTRSISRRNCVTPPTTKSSSQAYIHLAKEKVSSTTKSLRQEVHTTGTTNIIMPRPSPSLEKQDAQETPNLDETNSSSASSTVNVSSSMSEVNCCEYQDGTELEMMRKAQMNSSWYNIHVAMQSQKCGFPVWCENPGHQAKATFNYEMSSSLKHSGDGGCSSDMDETSQTRMKCSWYDAHRATEDRCSADDKDTEKEQENDIDANDADHMSEKEVIEMMRMYEPVQLRESLLIVQQQLQSYHSLLDSHEEVMSANVELEKKIGKFKTKFKKLADCYKKKRDEVKEMESQIIQLKLDLAEAKGQNDYNSARIHRVSVEKKMLEEENDRLRE